MYGNRSETHGYSEADLAIRTAASTPHQLVLMLFTGLQDELIRAKGHIVAKRFERKASSISKCIDILNALTSALDYERGGELAQRLASLYDYCVYRLYDASHNLSLAQIEEVEGLLATLREGWEGMQP
ncbi:flagellar export chaperone FliS [Pantoea sp. Mb-10]|uniref:flagellar export chaperone FliS n=1 Tax=unclassified Pantoea TaxID=2630326 RepID=UPI001E3FCA16|nr:MULTISPECIES: flagellar export chaperone FliS [unclassified Pantoea]MCE0489855.1 flagellar export chaperone FliS [Pantoea sp. Mb-10]MCE0501039.1 flagellar export chaperone FliS [Pantoea sp. Pb-8]